MWYTFVFMLTQTIAPVHVRPDGIGAAFARGTIVWPDIEPPAIGAAVGVAAGTLVALDDDDEEPPPHADVSNAAAVRHTQKRTMPLCMSHLL